MTAKHAPPIRALASLVLLLALPFAVAACGEEDEGGGSGASAAERAFLSGMVPHHESAVEMARMALDRGRHKEIRELARDIVSTQELEIRRMKEMHRRIFGERLVPDDGAHSELGLSAAEAGMEHEGMAALEKARPFDRAFIDSMIRHHAGAIRMAHAVMAEDPEDEIVDLADGIVQAQSKEIREMNRWRREWYGKKSPAGGVPQPSQSGGGGEHEVH